MIVSSVVSSHRLARASARKRAYSADETNARDECGACQTGTLAGHRERGGGEAATTKRQKKAKTGEKVIIPTPEEWAEEQLKNAPPRSEEWAKRVAQIYCLDIGDDDGEEEAVLEKT